MSAQKSCLMGIAILSFTAVSAVAGPCTNDITRVQKQVDAAIAANAGAGKMGQESTMAKLSHQPTPKSVAEADAKLNKWSCGEKAVAALQKARAADTANDAAGCRAALSEAEAAIGTR